MTNKEAIEQLKGIRSDYEADCKNSPFKEMLKEMLYRKDIEALDLAIKTLEEQRPQGEWNILQKDDNGIHEIECPFCKYSKGGRFTVIGVTFNELPYFCESCGADMRKGVIYD